MRYQGFEGSWLQSFRVLRFPIIKYLRCIGVEVSGF
jgi:hypothetical protein